MTANAAIFEWNGDLGLPQFDKIQSVDFADAFDLALTEDRSEIDAIAGQEAEPTFENTIERLELAGDKLSKTSSLFWNLLGADSDETLQALERDIAPRMSRHQSETAANSALFSRIDALWQSKEDLKFTTEQERVLERYWKSFVRGGAALERKDQARLAEINARLAELGASFSQNILADEKNWMLVLEDDADLEGLPDTLRDAMASAATERGHDRKFAVTLSRSIIEPFLSFSAHRHLREKAFKAWQARGESPGATDNRDIVRDIVHLRSEKAALLDYDSFSHFKLQDQMAKTPDAVVELLETVWDHAVRKATSEQRELEQLAASEGHNHPIEPWDWRYYAEKLRQEKFAYDDSEIKPYFALDSVIEAAFDVAHRLFGIKAKERKDIPVYHPDARVFEILNSDGSHRAVFIGDYFARPSKRSGAWMSGFQSQSKLGESRSPIIVNVMNFAKAPEGRQTLLSSDDARTLFHEFGHALHGILSDVTYPSVSGTAVARDFVELPSQLYEHWLTVPKILKQHARHVETGEPIPSDLLEKVIAANRFNAGFNAVEFTASALVDIEFHKPRNEPIEDAVALERETLERIGMPSAIAMRHRTPHFAHVFSGDGYSAGYYSYMWSEVLDADAFSAFEETGDVFDTEMARKLKAHIYSAGGSIDPEDAYVAFRGKMPGIEAMIEKRGLAPREV